MSESFDPDVTTIFTAPSTTPPGPGWWLADDGEWYPPETPPVTTKPSPGWWMASDGRWYPPGTENTTVIEPVAPANAYESWQPEPQPHDQLFGQRTAGERVDESGPAASAASGGGRDEDRGGDRGGDRDVTTVPVASAGRGVPTWAKAIGVLLLLLVVAVFAIAGLLGEL